MRCWIGGRAVTGAGSERELVDPATGATGATVADASLEQVDEAVRTAGEVLAGPWGAAVPEERGEVLLRLAELCAEHADELTELEIADTGKPITTMRDGELPFAIDNLRFFAGAARSLLGTGSGDLTRGYTSLIGRRPVGVVAAIVPWNFPLVIAIWKAAAALAAGCSIIVKPAPATPRSTVRLAELATAAGLPDGALNVVTGGADVGRYLAAEPGVAMVNVTGSTDTGREVMSAAAATVKRVHLELGGKAPLLAFSDAEPAAVAAGAAMGATYNSGQDCTAATRVYVAEDSLQHVTEALVAAMEAIRVGDPRSADTDIGPLISAAHRDRVHGYVSRARTAGAQVLCGGEPIDAPGSFYPPTVITDVDQSAEIVQEEVFGPVLVVLPFHDEEEAVQCANDVRYGLAASVWTEDVRRALRVARRLDFGVVWVNDHLPMSSEAPHGGLKGTGTGTDLSERAVLEHTVSRHVMIKHTEPDPRDGFRPA